jgi:hypothetical protein
MVGSLTSIRVDKSSELVNNSNVSLRQDGQMRCLGGAMGAAGLVRWV